MKLLQNNHLIGCILMLCITLGACKKGIPSEVLAQDKMEKLLYDYHLARAMADNLPYEEHYKQALYMDYVFRKNGTTQAQFDSSLVWYTRHTEEFSKLYDQVNKRLKAQQEEINHLIAARDNKPKISLPGDTVNVWNGKELYRLGNLPNAAKITFVAVADSNYKERDELLWRMQYTFLGKKKTGSAVMAFIVRYENDSLLTAQQTIDQSGLYSLRLKSDSAYAIKEISGFVYYVDSTGFRPNGVLIDRISLTRYHEKKDSLQMKTDSLRIDSLRTDSAANKQRDADLKIDTLKDSSEKEIIQPVRMRPGALNRPREVHPLHTTKTEERK